MLLLHYMLPVQVGPVDSRPAGLEVASSTRDAATSSYTPTTASSTIANTYTNQRLGFSFTIPPGYQLATNYMQFLNTASGNPIGNWSATNTEDVVVTASDESELQTFLTAAEGGGASSDVNPVAKLPDTVYVAAVAPTLATIESSLADVEQHHSDIVNISDVQHISVANAKGIRYNTLNLTNGDREESVYISFPEGSRLSSGLPVGTLLLMLSQNTNQNDDTLNEIVTTLKFN